MSFIDPIVPDGDWGISPNAVPMYEEEDEE